MLGISLQSKIYSFKLIFWQTFILRGYVADGHKVPSALGPEVIFRALFKLPWVFVPCDGGIVEGQLALEGGRVAFIDLDASDAFSELNLVG